MGPAGGPVPAGFRPSSVTFISAEQGWALGTAPCSRPPCTSIVRTRDGGRSWQGIPAPKAPIGPATGAYADGQVSTIRFADQANGWVAGSSVYATHDGGASWHGVLVGPAGGRVRSIGTGGGRVFAARSNCAPNAPLGCKPGTVVYAAPLTGDSWRAVSPTLSGSVPGLVVSSSGWYQSAPGGIYHGSGAAAPVTLADPCPPLGGTPVNPTVAVADQQHLDAMCLGGGAAGSADYRLYGSTDGGRHWAAAGPSHRIASGLFGLADNGAGVLLVATASGDSRVLRSTDDGLTLPARLRSASGGVSWSDLGFTTATQAEVVLDGRALYLSHDAGASWSAVRF